MENLILLQEKLAKLVGETCIDALASPPLHRFGLFHLVFPDLNLLIHCKWSLIEGQIRPPNDNDIDAVENTNDYTPYSGNIDIDYDTGNIKWFLHSQVVGRSVTAAVLDSQSLELDLQFDELHLKLLPTTGKVGSYRILWLTTQRSLEYLHIQGNSEILFGEIKWDN
jgi:hypothetical protein